MADEIKTTTAPWGGQKPYLKDIFAQAQSLANGPGPGFYPGRLTAGPTGSETAGSDWTKSLAYSSLAPQAQTAQGASDFLLKSALYPESNPALRQTAEAAVRPIFQNLTEQTMPQIRSDAFGSGLVGSNRQGIAEGLAAGRASDAAGDATSKIYSDAYGQGLDAMGRALAVAPNTQSMSLAAPNALAQAGTFDRSFEQAMIDEEVQRYQYGQNLPWNQLNQYQNLIQGGYGGTTTTPAPDGADPMMAGLGGALSGAAAGAPFAGMTGGWSIPIGAILGGSSGFFGSK